jgi:translation initiation factor IF-3
MRVNNRIRATRVRVIEGDQVLDVLPIGEAMAMARERGLDLVEVDASAAPPVCKIVDAGKYAYDARKRTVGARRRARTAEMKEIRLRPMTDPHDLAVKTRAVRRFLEDGHDVRLVVRFRGRELTHPEEAKDRLDAMLSQLADLPMITTPPTLEGRTMIVTVRCRR